MSDPRLTKPLTGCKDEALRGRIHGHVGRLLNDVETLKVNPHGMRGVRKPAVSESVSGEQVAELVVESRLWNTEDGDEGRSQRNQAQTHEQHRKIATASEATECALDPMESGRMIEGRGVARREKNQGSGGDQG